MPALTHRTATVRLLHLRTACRCAGLHILATHLCGGRHVNSGFTSAFTSAYAASSHPLSCCPAKQVLKQVLRTDSSSAELSISEDEDGHGVANPVQPATAEKEGTDGEEDDGEDDDDEEEDEEFLDYAVLQVLADPAWCLPVCESWLAF